MSTSSQKEPPHRRRGLARILRTTVVAVLAIFGLISGVAIVSFFFIGPLDVGPYLTTGCGEVPTSVVADPGRAKKVDVIVRGGATCDAEPGGGVTPLRIGTQVKAVLSSPTFPGQATLIGSEVQTLDDDRPEAQWTWEIVGNRPGEYSFSLIVSTVGDDGKTVIFQNLRSEVKFTVKRTLDYMAGRFLSSAGEFFASLLGIATSLAGIVAIMGGFAWRRQRRNSGKQSKAQGNRRLLLTQPRPGRRKR